jgi:hypothetical protein
MSTTRTPASVFERPTVILPRARSRSRQRSAVASPIRRPVNVSVAMSARRPAVRAFGEASSSDAASRSAWICGAVEPDRPLALRLQLAVAGADADRVARDEVALLGDGEVLPEPRDRLVDRLGREHALADLELAVAVDLSHGDLREPVCVEEREQVVRELP